ncbi:hypothetical protein QYF36_025737 [Acer negundo]|nr:hypothetical protein QYF36_025737 [Acer negundo]
MCTCFVDAGVAGNFTAHQAYSNISLGSSLTASKHKYGLYGLPGSLPPTIVWSSKRDVLVQERSKVELTKYGQLILRNPKSTQQWSAELSGIAVAYGAMLDTGNFVLASHDSSNLWESFDHPKDTILPTQTMNQGSKLVASISDTNYSSGRFMFTLETDGNVVMYTTDFPLGTTNYAYWSTQTSVDGGFQLYYNRFGHIYIEADNRRIANEIISNNEIVSPNFSESVILDYDGIFRHYIYYLNNSDSSVGQWSSWSNLPPNICWQLRDQQPVALAASIASAVWEMIRERSVIALPDTPS